MPIAIWMSIAAAAVLLATAEIPVRPARGRTRAG